MRTMERIKKITTSARRKPATTQVLGPLAAAHLAVAGAAVLDHGVAHPPSIRPRTKSSGSAANSAAR